MGRVPRERSKSKTREKVAAMRGTIGKAFLVQVSSWFYLKPETRNFFSHLPALFLHGSLRRARRSPPISGAVEGEVHAAYYVQA